MFSSIITFPDFIVEKGSVIDRRSCKGFLHETGHASTEKHQFLFEWWINIVWQGKEIEATTSPQQHSDKLLCGKLACLHSFLWNDKTKSWICRAVPGLWLMLSCGQVKSPHSLCRLRGEEKQGPPSLYFKKGSLWEYKSRQAATTPKTVTAHMACPRLCNPPGRGTT